MDELLSYLAAPPTISVSQHSRWQIFRPSHHTLSNSAIFRWAQNQFAAVLRVLDKKPFVEQIKAAQDELSRHAVERFTAMARDAIAKRGSFHVAVPGGSAAQLFFPLFASSAVQWSGVHVYWVDERQVPHDHAESNFRLANELWLSKVPAVAHPFDDCDEYLRILPPSLDLVVLGVGPDGHVASLFPGRPELQRTERAFEVHDAPKPPPDRRSLSLGEICSATHVWVVVTGAAKAQMLQEALQAESKLPVAQVFQRARRLTLWVDPPAAP